MNYLADIFNREKFKELTDSEYIEKLLAKAVSMIDRNLFAFDQERIDNIDRFIIKTYFLLKKMNITNKEHKDIFNSIKELIINMILKDNKVINEFRAMGYCFIEIGKNSKK